VFANTESGNMKENHISRVITENFRYDILFDLKIFSKGGGAINSPPPVMKL